MTPASALATPVSGENQYWASLKGEALCGAVDRKVQLYFRALDEIGMRAVWRVAYTQYFGMDAARFGQLTSQETRITGEQGEFIVFRVNDFRSLIRQQVTLAIGQRPAFQCLATNDDYDSLAQIEACDNAVAYTFNRAYGEDLERAKLEMQKIYGWAWDWHRWDDEGGDDVDVPDEATGGAAMSSVRSGAPTITPKPAWMAAHDPECTDGRHAWVVIADRRSKWELAAKYPLNLEDGHDQVAEILALDTTQSFGFDIQRGVSGSSFFRLRDTDSVTVRHFYHARTAAMPEGRYVGLAGNITLWDVPLPGEELPAVCFMPSRIDGTSFGYSEAWDLIPPQQMIDQIRADWATTCAAFGRPVLVQDEGTTITISQLARGMRLCTKKPGTMSPEFTSPPEMPESAFKLIEHLQSRMREDAGLFGPMRGDNTNIRSGEHAALVASTSLEFQSAEQQAVDMSREANGNRLLESIKINAKYPFLVEVAGLDEAAYLQSFETDRLRKVKRVRVVTADPMMRTTAGRVQMFQMMNSVPGAITSPDQVREIVISGRTKPTYDNGRSQDLRIRWENEQLAKGIAVPSLMGENPYKEIASHWAEVDKPAIRNNPQVLEMYLAHIQEHMRLYLQTDPVTCAIHGYPPPPTMGPAMGAPAANDNAKPGAPANDNGAPKSAAEPAQAESKLPKPSRSPVQMPDVAPTGAPV